MGRCDADDTAQSEWHFNQTILPRHRIRCDEKRRVRCTRSVPFQIETIQVIIHVTRLKIDATFRIEVWQRDLIDAIVRVLIPFGSHDERVPIEVSNLTLWLERAE